MATFETPDRAIAAAHRHARGDERSGAELQHQSLRLKMGKSMRIMPRGHAPMPSRNYFGQT